MKFPLFLFKGFNLIVSQKKRNASQFVEVIGGFYFKHKACLLNLVPLGKHSILFTRGFGTFFVNY